MKRSLGLALALALGVVSPVLAGGAKCEKDLASCVKEKAAALKDRGWVGIEMDENKETGATFVKKVVAGSPAEKAGLKDGDVLLALNGVQFDKSKPEAMKATYKDFKVGNTVKYSISRDGATLEVPVVLAALPDDIKAQWIGSYALELIKAEEQTAQVNP